MANLRPLWNNDSQARDAVTGQSVQLRLTDPDNLPGNAPPIDDIAVATSGRGTLYMVDAGAGTVVKLDTEGWPAGTVFVAEPSDNGNPLLGTLDLATGVITPSATPPSVPKAWSSSPTTTTTTAATDRTIDRPR